MSAPEAIRIVRCLANDPSIAAFASSPSNTADFDYPNFPDRSQAPLGVISGQAGKHCTGGGGGPAACTADDSLEVVFGGLKGHEQVIQIKRNADFTTGNPPPVDKVVADLVQKYGEPTSRGDYFGPTLQWVSDPAGQPMSKQNPAYSSCVNAAGSYLVEPACGLTILANLRTNDTAVANMQIVVINQAIAKQLHEERKALADRLNAPTGSAPKL
jgi:hypothetical protein